MSNHQTTIKNKYIVLPVNMNSKTKKISFYEGDDLIFDFDAHIDFNTPQYYSYINIERFRGRTVFITSEPRIDIRFTFVDAIPMAGIYKEELRPMVHFTSRIGWINDPNGLTYYNGRYHMFFQHNPAGSDWGNMTWGHAISDDLIHWHETDSALCPDELGTMFSGSGIIDKDNLSGLKESDSADDLMLLYYTAAGGCSALSKGKLHTQCLAYSNDGGLTFKKYENNPVIDHIIGGNRDPKIQWCDELSCHILALYLDRDEYALFSTKDMIHFTEIQRLRLRGDDECPDIYPLYLENDRNVRKWVFSGASDRYLVGDFKDGRFVPCQESTPYFYGHRTSYAAQTFSGTENRRIKIAWQVLHAPGSVFDNQMGIPCDVSLVRTESGFRLRTLPVPEFNDLRVGTEIHRIDKKCNFVRPLHRKAYDIEIKAPRDCADFTVNFFGYSFAVKISENTLSYNDVTMPLSYTGDDINIRIITDVLGCEVFSDNGLIYSVASSLADYGIRYMSIDPINEGEHPELEVTLHTLRSIH